MHAYLLPATATVSTSSPVTSTAKPRVATCIITGPRVIHQFLLTDRVIVDLSVVVRLTSLSRSLLTRLSTVDLLVFAQGTSILTHDTRRPGCSPDRSAICRDSALGKSISCDCPAILTVARGVSGPAVAAHVVCSTATSFQ